MTVYEFYNNVIFDFDDLMLSISNFIPSEITLSNGDIVRPIIKDFLETYHEELDVLYLNKSANKTITHFFSTDIPEVVVRHLTSSLAIKYCSKWENALRILFVDAFSADYYDPYSLKETSTDDETVNKNTTSERNDESELTSNGTTTNTRNGSNTQVGSGTTDTNYNTYGFNSSIPVPTDDNTNTVSNEVTNTITDSDIGSDEKTEIQTATINNTTTDAMTRQNNLIRELRGNIGNLTRDNISAGRLDMLARNLIDIILDDIDSVLTLQYYGGY